MNTATKLLHLIVSTVGILLFSVALLTAAAPGTAPAVATVAAPTQTGMFNPVARLDTSRITDLRPTDADRAAADAAAEGEDVLPLSFHEAPSLLWNALLDQHPEWYDDDVAGIGTFWVPVGTVVDVPGGLALATLDGWMGCQDWVTSDAECSATGPVEPIGIELVPATVIYGADDLAQCSTDAQCAALDEDRKLAGLDELDGPAYGTEQDTDTAQDASTDTAQVLTVAHTTRTGDRPNTWCYRDKVCVEVGIPAEDGSRVPFDYYRHVTKTGATQARCDYLGKRRVSDPVYGHRCV